MKKGLLKLVLASMMLGMSATSNVFVLPAHAEETTVQTQDITGATVTVEAGKYVYKARPITPAIAVTYNGVVLVQDVDYTISYLNNVNAGTATVTATGINAYSGMATATFTIQKAVPTITYEKSYTEEDKVWSKPRFQIVAKSNCGMGVELKSMNKKIITIKKMGFNYAEIKGPGKTKIVITSPETANYKKKVVKASVTIKPSSPGAWLRYNRTDKKFTFGWNEVEYAKGYQVQYSTDKNFKKNVVKKSYKNKASSKKSITVTKLKKGKRYYARVRCYINWNGKKLYSKWVTLNCKM